MNNATSSARISTGAVRQSSMTDILADSLEQGGEMELSSIHRRSSER
jgi:hypothetical protein